MLEEAREVIYEAKRHGLACVIWSYPRGGELEKTMETALDVVAYGAHIAVSLGAHIVKVKLPTDYVAQSNVHSIYEKRFTGLRERVAHIMQCCFSGKRLVVFSGGASKEPEELYREVTAIREGGGNGSIIGRNVFQRPRETALKILNDVTSVYLGKNLDT
jgi:class I fructose-bisphosphate aldolase